MTQALKNTQNLFTVKEMADYFRISIATSNSWRFKRIGPKYCKIGKLVYYHKADLDAWLEERSINPEAE